MSLPRLPPEQRSSSHQPGSMSSRTIARWSRDRPIRALVAFFVLWKSWLLLVTQLSPGPPYDTSTSLLLSSHDPSPALDRHGLLEKLTRWDAIYFASIARRDYRFEQEWAFGWGFTRLVKLFSRALVRGSSDTNVLVAQLSPRLEIIAAIVIAHVSHLLSVLVLYHLTRTVFRRPRTDPERLALLSAALHVISPAGLFLSAPYAESLFSWLSFLAHLLYAQSLAGTGRDGWKRDARVVLSGFLFGAAGTVRSNGLLGGLLFLCDASLIVFRGLREFQSIGLPALRRLAALVLGGCLVASGMLIPQWIAYDEFCRRPASSTSAGLRPWCGRLVPSIYSWNQDHYWNVGFLRYWTVSNLPLFGLAAPMLALMFQSAIWAIKGDALDETTSGAATDWSSNASGRAGQTGRGAISAHQDITQRCLWRFAVPQLVLTVFAVLVYHVQIITRISSGYVIWYWWLAWTISPGDDRSHRAADDRGKGNRGLSKLVVRWMVIYATVQGGLFASFLPPA
ncbi:MAG: ER membrane glycoprotein subunit of the GPI transamidase complex-like protein [Sclerophora amabilis]|nr:MAG: ER membrane glycoprotein subunit of the GPI transamidase complex-like protein [Sclerophora amabilis]